ncbi:MAG: Ig-like domain-containing protein, partial [Reichenbachiella sp.]
SYTLTGAGSGNYSITQPTGLTSDITAIALTVTVSADDKVYDGATTATVGTASLVGIINSEVVSIDASPSVWDFDNSSVGTNKSVTATTGSYTLTGAGSGNYSITQPTGLSADVTTKALTITATAQDKTYGSALTGGTGYTTFTSIGLENSETIGSVTVAYSDGDAAADAVGSYTDAISLSTATGGTFTASNYSITYATGDLDVLGKALTITATAQDKTYGSVLTGGTGYTTFTSIGLENSETIGSVTVAYSEGDAAADAVGSYTDAISLSTATGGTFTASNYSITYATGDLDVLAKALTITAAAQDKTYGSVLTGGTGYTTFTSIGLENSETIGSVTVAYSDGEAAAYAVGNYTDAISLSTATGGTFTASNYSITYATGDLAVTAIALTVTANGSQTKVYGGSDPTFTYTIAGFVNGDVEADLDAAVAIGRAAGENVGSSYTITPSAAADANYTVSFVTSNFTITAKSIELTADAVSKTYGDADPSLTYTVTSGSLETGDGFTGDLARTTGEDVNTYAISIGTITAGDNYTTTFVSDDLTITAKSIEVTSDAVSKTYGDTDPSLTYAITSGSLETGDAFTGDISRATGENVGSYAIGQNDLALSSNYILSYVGANLTITPLSIEITVDAISKTEGSSDPVFTYQVTSGSLKSGDSFSGSLTRTVGETINSYAITLGSLTAGSNYDITFITADLTISGVTLGNTAPVAVVDDFTFNQGSTNAVLATDGVLNNDTDSEDDALTAILVSDVSNGTLTLNSDGSFDYVHDGSVTTTDSFSYKVNDGTDDGNTVTVSLTITPVTSGNTAPVAVVDEFTFNQGSTNAVLATDGVLNNDTDSEDDALTAILVSDVSNGTL